MTVFQRADLLVNIFTLDDVATREGFRLAEVEDAFVNLIEAAALDVAEHHFSGHRQTGAAHVDWNGSRLQFWASYSRQVYELVIFQFDHNELAPLVCCASQDFVYGSRSLTAQFAVMRNGRKVHLERLPESDLRRRRRPTVPAPRGSANPTLHRLIAAAFGAWSRLRKLLWRAVKAAGDACLSFARRIVSAAAAVRDQCMGSMIMAALRMAYGRVLALVGCTAETCDGSARNPTRRFGAPFGLGGILAAVSSLSSRLWPAPFGGRTIETRNEFISTQECLEHDDAIFCANPVTDDHLATLHGIKPLEPMSIKGIPGKLQSSTDEVSHPGNRT